MQRRIIAVAVPSIGPLLPCEQNRLFMDDSSRHRSSGAQRRAAPTPPVVQASIVPASTSAGVSLHSAYLPRVPNYEFAHMPMARRATSSTHAYPTPWPRPRQTSGPAMPSDATKAQRLAGSRHNLSDSAHAGTHRGVQQPGDHADAPFVLPALAEVHATQAAPREQSAHVSRRNTSAAEDATVPKRHAAAPVRIHRRAHPTSSQQHGSKETNMDWRLSASRSRSPSIRSPTHAMRSRVVDHACSPQQQQQQHAARDIKSAAVDQLDDQTGASPARAPPGTSIVADRAGGLKLAVSSKQQAAAKAPQPPKAAEPRAPVAASGGSSGAAREARQLTDSLFVTHNALPPAACTRGSPLAASAPAAPAQPASPIALPASASEQTRGRRAKQAAKATVAPFEVGASTVTNKSALCATLVQEAGSSLLEDAVHLSPAKRSRSVAKADGAAAKQPSAAKAPKLKSKGKAAPKAPAQDAAQLVTHISVSMSDVAKPSTLPPLLGSQAPPVPPPAFDTQADAAPTGKSEAACQTLEQLDVQALSIDVPAASAPSKKVKKRTGNGTPQAGAPKLQRTNLWPVTPQTFGPSALRGDTLGDRPRPRPPTHQALAAAAATRAAACVEVVDQLARLHLKALGAADDDTAMALAQAGVLEAQHLGVRAVEWAVMPLATRVAFRALPMQSRVRSPWLT